MILHKKEASAVRDLFSPKGLFGGNSWDGSAFSWSGRERNPARNGAIFGGVFLNGKNNPPQKKKQN